MVLSLKQTKANALKWVVDVLAATMDRENLDRNSYLYEDVMATLDKLTDERGELLNEISLELSLGDRELLSRIIRGCAPAIEGLKFLPRANLTWSAAFDKYILEYLQSEGGNYVKFYAVKADNCILEALRSRYRVV